jgi:hypothetical protein
MGDILQVLPRSNFYPKGQTFFNLDTCIEAV